MSKGSRSLIGNQNPSWPGFYGKGVDVLLNLDFVPFCILCVYTDMNLQVNLTSNCEKKPSENI